LAKAKRVLFLFMSGGPSQMDLFDPKPELLKRTGQALPYKLPDTEATVGLDQTKLLGPIAGFEPHGQSGLMVSELLPLTGKHADDLCVLRAVQADSPNHPLAIRQMHTGNLFDVRPLDGLVVVLWPRDGESTTAVVHYPFAASGRSQLLERFSTGNPPRDGDPGYWLGRKVADTAPIGSALIA